MIKDGFFIIANKDGTDYHIKANQWNLGYCTDGDFNSITIEFTYFGEEPPSFSGKIFMLETTKWLVEESSISKINYNYIKSSVKLLIHFHSKIIRGDDMAKIKHRLKRKSKIKNILKRK